MTDGTRFLTGPSTNADSLAKTLQRPIFAQVELEEETIHINPAHVACVPEQ